MNKPDWGDAPDWAQYLAMDEDGEWYWYEDEPSKRGGEINGYWHSTEKHKIATIYWQDTLEARP